MKILNYLPLSSLLIAGACASAPPPTLVDARAAYARAEAGDAQRLAPADLHVAKQALDLAETTYQEEGGDDQMTIDRAYIALRKVEIAEARAGTIDADDKANAAREAALRQLTAEAEANKDKLANTEKALEGAETRLEGTNEMLRGTKEALAAEQAKREEAEKRAEKAAADLSRFASVKQETRGMVITISGSVLFVSGKSELLPTAMAKLTQVAQSLTREDPDSAITIEGHTDSQGSQDLNQRLSTARAESVRTFLISQGVAADRITAVGLAFSRPVADNKSAEGRANNRRVEIIVQPQPNS